MRFFVMLGAMIASAIVCLLVVVVLASGYANAQETNIPRGLGHPQGGGAHWYDTGCCSMKDCEPVEPGAIVMTPEGYHVRYLTSRGWVAEGFIPHGSSAIRQSRDSQEHACAITTERVLCIYIHMGV
jgi:hypothetical protein